MGRAGNVIIDTAVWWAFLIVLVNYGLQATDLSLKAKSPKMIANPLHSTTDGVFREIAGYAVWKAGAIDAYGVHTKGSEGTVVVPLACIHNYGRNVAFAVRIEPVELEELPPDVIKLVVREKFPKPYLYGIVDENIIMHYPEITFLKNELKQRNRENKTYLDMLEGKSGAFESHVSHMRRIVEKQQGGFMKKLWKESQEE
jgi:hypothetical protein